MRLPISMLALLMSLFAATVAEARSCKPAYTAMGPLTQPTQHDAERSAKVQWKTEIAHRYGSDYADWDKAQSQEMECEEIAEYFRCWATATPCR
ncbi:MAG TPA: hypothetical protein VMW68_00210 [Methyloceanibacter sp.]|nr:hypothetical protein [Methyloceanibacter sp.]